MSGVVSICTDPGTDPGPPWRAPVPGVILGHCALPPPTPWPGEVVLPAFTHAVLSEHRNAVCSPSCMFPQLPRVSFWPFFMCAHVDSHPVTPDSAIPWTVAQQAPPSTGFPRQECWSGLPFFLLRGSLQAQGSNSHLLSWQAGSLPPSHQGRPSGLFRPL